MRWCSGGWSSPRSSTAWPTMGRPARRAGRRHHRHPRRHRLRHRARQGWGPAHRRPAPRRRLRRPVHRPPGRPAPHRWARATPGGAGHRRRDHADGFGRPTGRVGRLRHHHRHHGPPHRHRPHRHLRRLFTDDEGRVLHAGTTTYRPPDYMTRTVIARDVHCMFPGCRKKPATTTSTTSRPTNPATNHHREPDVAPPAASPLQTRRGTGPSNATTEPASPPGPTPTAGDTDPTTNLPTTGEWTRAHTASIAADPPEFRPSTRIPSRRPRSESCDGRGRALARAFRSRAGGFCPGLLTVAGVVRAGLLRRRSVRAGRRRAARPRCFNGTG